MNTVPFDAVSMKLRERFFDFFGYNVGVKSVLAEYYIQNYRKF